MMEAELFDGTVLEFPDGTSPDVIQRVVKQQTAQRRGVAPAQPGAGPAAAPPAAAPAPVQEPGLIDTIMDYGATGLGVLDQVGRGAAEGVTNIAGLPRAIQQGGLGVLQFGLDKVGAPQGVQDAVGGFANAIDVFPSTEGMQSALDAANNATAGALGVEAPRGAPDNMAERAANRVSEEVMAALIPVGGAVRKAQQVGVEGARALPTIQRMFVEPAAVNPARFIQKEVTMATGAGLGAAGAGEVARAAGAQEGDLSAIVADVIGALGGAGLTSVANATLPRVKDVVSALFGNADYASDVTRQAVVDTIIGNSDTLAQQAGQTIDTAPLANRLAEPARAEQVIPGFRASTADRAGDFGLASLEDARARGGGAGRFKDRSAANTEAVEGALAPIRPQQQPGALRSAIEASQDARIADATRTTGQARDAFDRTSQALRPAMTADARGADIRSVLENASEAAQTAVRQAWAPLNQSDQVVDVAPLGERYNQIGNDLSVAERRRFQPAEANIPAELTTPGTPATPETPSSILGPDGRPLMRPGTPETPASGEVPLREVTGIRSALTDARREALNAGRRNEARIIDEHITALDGFLDQNVPDELSDAYGAARAARLDYGDRFERPQTAIAQTLDHQQGQYRTPNSGVAGKFVQNDEGNVQSFQSLIREAGNDPRTRAAVRDQMLADVRDRGLLGDPAGLDDYLGRYGTVLNELPQLRTELGNAAGLRRALGTAEDTERGVMRDYGPGGRSAPTRYAAFGNEQAERAMAGVISSKNPTAEMDEILTFVGDDPTAVDGARRAFWDVMERKGRSSNAATETASGVDPWMPKKWRSWLEQPNVQAAASRLYRDNPEHWENLNQIADALRNVNTRTKAGSTVNPSGTAQSQRGRNLTTAEVQAKYADVMRGRLSKAYFVTYFAGRIAQKAVAKQSEQAFNMLLDRALMDPETAALLLRENNPANRAALLRSAKGWMGNQAATLVNAMSADDEDDETVGAVMRSGG